MEHVSVDRCGAAVRFARVAPGGMQTELAVRSSFHPVLLLSSLRPPPPPESLRVPYLEEGIPVDVYSSDVWWQGVLRRKERSVDDGDSESDSGGSVGGTSAGEDPSRWEVYCKATRDTVNLHPSEPGRRAGGVPSGGSGSGSGSGSATGHGDNGAAPPVADGMLRAGLEWRRDDGVWLLRTNGTTPFDPVQLARGGAAAATAHTPGGSKRGADRAGDEGVASKRAAGARARRGRDADDDREDECDDGSDGAAFAPRTAVTAGGALSVCPGGTRVKSKAKTRRGGNVDDDAGGVAPPAVPAPGDDPSRPLLIPTALASLFITRERLKALLDAPGATPASVCAMLPGCLARTYETPAGAAGSTHTASRMWVVRSARMRSAAASAAGALACMELVEDTGRAADSNVFAGATLAERPPGGTEAALFIESSAAKSLTLARCRAVAANLATAYGIVPFDADTRVPPHSAAGHAELCRFYLKNGSAPAFTLLAPPNRTAGAAIVTLATTAVHTAAAEAAQPIGASAGVGSNSAAPACAYAKCKRAASTLGAPHYCYLPPPNEGDVAPPAAQGPFCLTCIARFSKHFTPGFGLWRHGQGPPPTTTVEEVLGEFERCEAAWRAQQEQEVQQA